MSVSKWAWTPACDKGICVGECDRCDKAKWTDVVEVVRCKDCIHHKPLAILEGEHICEVHNWQSGEDDFCSFAERREDGEIR